MVVKTWETRRALCAFFLASICCVAVMLVGNQEDTVRESEPVQDMARRLMSSMPGAKAGFIDEAKRKAPSGLPSLPGLKLKKAYQKEDKASTIKDREGLAAMLRLSGEKDVADDVEPVSAAVKRQVAHKKPHKKREGLFAKMNHKPDYSKMAIGLKTLKDHHLAKMAKLLKEDTESATQRDWDSMSGAQIVKLKEQVKASEAKSEAKRDAETADKNEQKNTEKIAVAEKKAEPTAAAGIGSGMLFHTSDVVPEHTDSPLMMLKKAAANTLEAVKITRPVEAKVAKKTKIPAKVAEKTKIPAKVGVDQAKLAAMGLHVPTLPIGHITLPAPRVYPKKPKKAIPTESYDKVEGEMLKNTDWASDDSQDPTMQKDRGTDTGTADVSKLEKLLKHPNKEASQYLSPDHNGESMKSFLRQEEKAMKRSGQKTHSVTSVLKREALRESAKVPVKQVVRVQETSSPPQHATVHAAAAKSDAKNKKHAVDPVVAAMENMGHHLPGYEKAIKTTPVAHESKIGHLFHELSATRHEDEQ